MSKEVQTWLFCQINETNVSNDVMTSILQQFTIVSMLSAEKKKLKLKMTEKDSYTV